MSPNKFYLCLELFQAISCLQGALLFTNIFNLICVVSCFPLTVLVVQWSAYVSYTPIIWVRLLLTSKSCFWFLVRNDENKSKEVEVRPFLNCFEMSEKFFLPRCHLKSVSYLPHNFKQKNVCFCWPDLVSSVTRLGDFLHFGQLFKAFGSN